MYPFKTINFETVKNNGISNELFERIILKFYHEFINCENTIFSLEHQEFKEYIHKLKGSSGTIGAKKLYDFVVLFYKDLNDKSHDEKRLLQLIDELNLVLDEIYSFFKPQIINKNSFYDNSFEIELSEYNIDNLIAVLKVANLKNIKKEVSEFLEKYPDAKNNVILNKVFKEIEQYNFKKALVYLEKGI
jgi:HPt (histidine-containing phosphotransfer) domain-containing protein